MCEIPDELLRPPLWLNKQPPSDLQSAAAGHLQSKSNTGWLLESIGSTWPHNASLDKPLDGESVAVEWLFASQRRDLVVISRLIRTWTRFWTWWWWAHLLRFE